MNYNQTVLDNGLKIVTVPMADNPTVTVLVMVEAGTRYETQATNGLSHFLEHMCFKGTEKRTSREIAYTLDALGAQSNAFTSYDYTGYYAKGRTDRCDDLLEIVADVYMHSTFPDAEIEKERGVICGEIDMYEDMPHMKARELLTHSMYGDQPAGYNVLGPKENIKRFTRDDFITYRNAHYVAAKTTIVVAGNITSSVLEKKIEHVFKNIPTAPRITKENISQETGQRSVTYHKATDQSHIALGIRALPMGYPDAHIYDVAVALLGQGMSSRLFTRLREEMGAGYYVRAGYTAGDDSGEFDITTGTEPVRVAEVLEAIAQELDRLRNETVSLGELEKTKESLVGGLYMGLESSDAVAFHVAQFVIFNKPIKDPKTLEQEIRKVTPDDIQRIAQTYFVRSNIHAVIVGPHHPQEVFGVLFGKS